MRVRTLRPGIPTLVAWCPREGPWATDITEATIGELALPPGFVDVQACAVSDVWSGLKPVIRKELRGQPR